MTPVRGKEPFDSSSHMFEVMWDGTHALAFLEGGTTRLQDQWGRDVSNRYPELASMALAVLEDGVLLDGEIVCLDAQGGPDVAATRARAGAEPGQARRLASKSPVTYQAFDMLYAGGRSVESWSLRRRRDMLRSLTRPGDSLMIPEWVERDGVALFEAARTLGLPGIAAREAGSRYQEGRASDAWVAIRICQKGEFVVGGYTYAPRLRGSTRPGSRPTSLSLLLGLFRNDGRLDYVGEVTGTFDEENIPEIMRALDASPAAECPFASMPRPARLVFWCNPEVVVTAGYAEWAESGLLRFPVFEALRPDVPAYSCRFEQVATRV